MFRLGLLIGFGIGYLFGTKAGRERYQEILQMYQRITSDQRFQEMMEKGRAVVDLSTERAREMMSEGFSAASDKVRDMAKGDGDGQQSV